MKATLQSAMKEAMKAKDKVRLDTIRGLLSAMQYEEMQKGVDSLDATTSALLLQTELKKRREEVEFAEKGGREDLKAQLAIEIATIESFLPKQFSGEEIEKILSTLKDETPGLNVGAAMKVLKERYSGQYDGKLASDVAKRVLG